MKLRSLRLHGFKSFADRTEVTFHDGVTAVVGPNGCGKSNISDAIRWVLGEQRPTAIRGAKMEEAIFQGTVHRRPVNRGSVVMTVSNEDGALPVAFKEVEIARTVYRDGGSEYSLNRSVCRLRDIQDLYRDTGLGANAYSVIENRMIDAILSDRAEERRGLFEEAAGIGKYKDRRKAAARRIERAEMDLQRLEDLVAEVQSKVRSLARQKGKAERYLELRKRRLDVELTVARMQIEELADRSVKVKEALEEDALKDEGLTGKITTVETQMESIRAERLEAERERTAVAGRLDEARTALVRWERELAVAEERATHAVQRIERIGIEEAEEEGKIRETTEAEEALRTQLGAIEESLGGVRQELDGHSHHVAVVRDELVAARTAVSEVERREQEVARRMAQLHGDAEGAEARAAELEARLGHLARELEEAHEVKLEVASQGDLFTDRVAALSREVDGARSRLESVQQAVATAREELRQARQEEMAAENQHGSLATRQAALSRMEEDREGVDPVVQAILASPRDGVLGILADFLDAQGELSRTVESCLGIHLRALVVRDTPTAMELARWFREEWKGGGGLIVLPLDRVPASTGEGGLFARVSARGDGAPWVRALLGGIDLDETLAGNVDGRGGRVAPDGSWVESGGVLRFGNPLGTTGLLERRDRLRSLQDEVAAAEKALTDSRLRREQIEEGLHQGEGDLDRLRGELRKAEDAFREAQAQEAARSDRMERVESVIREIEGQIALSRTNRTTALDRSAEAVRERTSLLDEEEELRGRRTESRERLDLIQDRWDEVRAIESRLTIERTRLEGEASRASERLQDLDRVRKTAVERIGALGREKSGLEEERARLGALREEGAAELERLFTLRTEVEAELGERDRILAALQEKVAGAEKEVREARAAERSISERRHALELEARDIAAAMARVTDRLEGEWGRTFEALAAEAEPVEGVEDELRAELREVVEAIDRIGPVNMLAVEEHEEESTRLDFLSKQREDLVEARNNLRDAIREINQTATRLFNETFTAVREHFRLTFLRLFEGGECDLWLADPDDPLESAIEIHAAPRGKKTQRIDLLSGGERALTALSLLFGIYLVKPSPFCVLDEVDAPLDESNIGRFIRLLHEFKKDTQFVVITHNPRTIEAADWIYGVTMEEPGVSTIVGVRLEEAMEVAGVRG